MVFIWNSVELRLRVVFLLPVSCTRCSSSGLSAEGTEDFKPSSIFFFEDKSGTLDFIFIDVGTESLKDSSGDLVAL